MVHEKARWRRSCYTAELKLLFLYRFWRIEPDAFHVVVLKLLASHLEISKIHNWNSSLYSRVFY